MKRLIPALAMLVIAAPALAQTVTVQKSPLCGCCTGWVEHMEAKGYEVAVRDVDDATLERTKERLGIAPEHRSCHTAEIDGYVIEGHVPAADIVRLLDERPQARGLAAPGMPVGSPGMEMGNRTEPYDVLLLDDQGGATVFQRHD